MVVEKFQVCFDPAAYPAGSTLRILLPLLPPPLPLFLPLFLPFNADNSHMLLA